MLFSIGNGQVITDVLTGMYKNIPIRIFSYATIVGSGKSAKTYPFTVCEATFDAVLPDIKLHTKTVFNNMNDFEYSWGDSSVTLEGDFNKYFSLRVPKGTEVQAYEALPPDVMSVLIDKARGLNFELCGSHVYVYVPKIVSHSRDLQSLLSLAEYLFTVFNVNVSGIKNK